MKKNLTFWLCLMALLFGVFGVIGCSGGGESGTSQADIDKVNKDLPPTDATPPPIPTRDGVKTGKAK